LGKIAGEDGEQSKEKVGRRRRGKREKGQERGLK
jgi:hypothetical protein